MKNKIVFTWGLSNNGNQIYHIQYIDDKMIPRYLGIVPADYLSTAVWFYRIEGMEIEVVGKYAGFPS